MLCVFHVDTHKAQSFRAGWITPYRMQANPPIELLSDAEKQALIDWAEAGAPQESCEPVAATKKPAPAKRGGGMKSR